MQLLNLTLSASQSSQFSELIVLYQNTHNMTPYLATVTITMHQYLLCGNCKFRFL